MSAKFCLFCGKRPEGKNKEHVLPRWLLEMTGNPTRTGNFGVDLSQGVRNATLRQYAFSQFQFPACQACNDRFGSLEMAAKPLILKLLTFAVLTPAEMTLLLDWLDKVRIGLWLAFHQLDKNYEGIIPRFYVRHRIGIKDRLVVVSYGKEKRQQLSFAGPTTLAFRFLPSAFGLIINHLSLINVSCDYLFARRLGFPFPRGPLISLGAKRHDYCELSRGLHRVLRPIYSGSYTLAGVAYYQPMFPRELELPVQSYYDTDYVKAHSLDWQNGIGNIYFTKGDSFGWLNENNNTSKENFSVFRKSLEKEMVLSVISVLQHLNKYYSPNYRLHDGKSQRMIHALMRGGLEELGNLQRMVRSWPQGRPRLGKSPR